MLVLSLLTRKKPDMGTEYLIKFINFDFLRRDNVLFSVIEYNPWYKLIVHNFQIHWSLFEPSPNVFTEFSEFSDKNNITLKKRITPFEPAISYVRNQHYTYDFTSSR